MKIQFCRLSICIAVALLASEAEAQLTICNKSAITVDIAIAEPQGQDWATRGWYAAKPGECITLISDVLWNQYYYAFATGNQGKSQWNGPVEFCVHPANRFSIIGRSQCTGENQRRGFFEMDTRDQRVYTHNLNP